jgi:hypothetical protein
MKENYEYMWTPNLKLHTVHVQDVVAGIWHLLLHGTGGEIYNLVDSNQTGKTGKKIKYLNLRVCRSG